jgi:hypothetical protein
MKYGSIGNWDNPYRTFVNEYLDSDTILAANRQLRYKSVYTSGQGGVYG